nr:site-specific integrase [Pseudomonas typographi]
MPAIIEIAIETAMRRSELLALRRENIKGKHALVEDTKNGARRLVPLSTYAWAVLESLPARLDGAVFSLARHTVSQYFLKACRGAQVKHLHFHDLRHEGTSKLFEKGLSIMEAGSIRGTRRFRCSSDTRICAPTPWRTSWASRPVTGWAEAAAFVQVWMAHGGLPRTP